MPEKNIILDTGAISLFFVGGKLGEQVKPYFDLIARKKRKGWIHEITLTEFEYKACQILGLEIARHRVRLFLNSNWQIVSGDGKIAQQAAELKCKHPRQLSLADCYVCALGLATNGLIFTTDSKLTLIKKLKINLLSLEL
jgi:PIN domain nuclease of toxin-antitoxin system